MLGVRSFLYELRGFPRRAQQTVKSRGVNALLSDCVNELAQRLRRGSLAPQTPATAASRIVTWDAPLVFPQSDPVVASIVIPAFNQIDLTLSCLESVLGAGSELAYEVVLVDDGSTDATRTIERLVKNVNVL